MLDAVEHLNMEGNDLGMGSRSENGASAAAAGPSGPPSEEPPQPRIPRSAASIAYALDLLDAELEAEEHEDSLGSTTDLVAFLAANEPKEGKTHSAYTYRVPSGPAGLAKAISSVGIMPSHPLNFTEQFPHITVITTAALPWLTGTAVNPALRAAYLWRRGHAVTLMVPWVPPDVQPCLFPDGTVVHTQEEQLEAIQASIQQRTPFPLPPLHLVTPPPSTHSRGPSLGEGIPDVPANVSVASPDDEEHSFQLVFYPGRYDRALGSIIPEADLQALVPTKVDCIILEEPEHLTWYHTGRRWTRAFSPHVPVVGIMHTNYVDYARRMAGEAAAGTLKRLNKFLCRQHTHKVIKLSDAVQKLPREETVFVHGVSDSFLAVGKTKAKPAAEQGDSAAAGAEASGAGEQEAAQPSRFTKGAYFLGKALWAKGFAELLDRFTEHKARCEVAGEDPPPVDVFGKGEQLEAIKAEAAKRGLPLSFLGAKDHLSPDMAEYRLFVNPSTSDVVATTSAEALAMGKWLLVPRHPCNEFLSTFPNCIVYDDAEGFSAGVERALTEDPAPLGVDDVQRLTWESATDRLLFCCASAEVGKGHALARAAQKTGWVGYNVGYAMYAVVSGAIESVRKALTVTETTPEGEVNGERGSDVKVESHALPTSPSLALPQAD